MSINDALSVPLYKIPGLICRFDVVDLSTASRAEQSRPGRVGNFDIFGIKFNSKIAQARVIRLETSGFLVIGLKARSQAICRTVH